MYLSGLRGSTPKFYKCVTKSVEIFKGHSLKFYSPKTSMRISRFRDFFANNPRNWYRKSEKCFENCRHYARWQCNLVYFVH